MRRLLAAALVVIRKVMDIGTRNPFRSVEHESFAHSAKRGQRNERIVLSIIWQSRKVRSSEPMHVTFHTP